MICFYKTTNNWFKRIIMSVIIAILAMNFVSLLRVLIDVLENISFTSNSYFINSLKSFISDDKLTGVLDNRNFIYEYSMTTIKENFFGVGIGTFQTIYQVFPHNIFLDILLTYGFLWAV
ncbi:hypothetical protein PDK16_27005 [Bacillus cereus]|nr:hypothetical protein [Bacillus cereus]